MADRSPISEVNIKQAEMCWNCKHGWFPDRRSSAPGKGEGCCLVNAGKPPFSNPWKPPQAFWDDVINGSFANTYEQFSIIHAFAYWTDMWRMDRGSGMYVQKPEKEFQRMKWVYENREEIIRVRWDEVCEAHE